MNKKVAVCAMALVASLLNSCDSPVGQGAGYGAAAGAIIGGAATGRVRGAAVGAAIVPEGGYPIARWSGTPGLVVSPYSPHRLVDVRGIPRGALVRDPSSGGIFRKP